MCRWIAYSGGTVPLGHYVTEPRHSLVAQSIKALESTAATNGDGFGLGWYGEHTEPGLYREIRPAWSDENLRYLCHHLKSHLFFAHVRAATGTPVVRPNCHPFACGRWMFMHNGFVGAWAQIRRRIECLIPDAIYPSRMGTTDSEALFLAMLGAGVEGDPIGATEQILKSVVTLIAEADPRQSLRFTSALANGQDLYAFRFAFNDSANTLYYKTSISSIVVVSEPLDGEAATWKVVPENHVLIARANCAPEIRALRVPSPRAIDDVA